MRTGFEEIQAAYNSGSQKARVWTEGWVAREAYCDLLGLAHPKSLDRASGNS